MSSSELKAVQEVDEDEAYSEHETNLFGYEDEEEGDEIFTSHRGSSIGSLEDIPCVRSVSSSPPIRHYRHPRLTRSRHVSDLSRQKPRLNRRNMPQWKLSDSSDASKIWASRRRSLRLLLQKLRAFLRKVSLASSKRKRT